MGKNFGFLNRHNNYHITALLTGTSSLNDIYAYDLAIYKAKISVNMNSCTTYFTICSRHKVTIGISYYNPIAYSLTGSYFCTNYSAL